MWRNYFFQIQKKYNMRASTTSPLVIRFDGKDVTKNKEINFFDIYDGSFTDSLERTIKFFTEKYHGFAIFGSDEASFIFPDPIIVISDIDVDKYNYTNEITGLFAQHFFYYFNNIYRKNTIFWHCKSFSIPEDKIKSYIKYRSSNIRNVMATYFLKKKGIRLNIPKLEDKITEIKKLNDYNILEKVENGILYFDGNRIDMKNYIEKDMITKVDLPENIEYIDLSSF